MKELVLYCITDFHTLSVDVRPKIKTTIADDRPTKIYLMNSGYIILKEYIFYSHL